MTTTEPPGEGTVQPRPEVVPSARAVALAYRTGDAAPRVVAKGQGLVAQTIIERAREAGVYVHQSPELVSLLMQVDLDQRIPPQLYIAVAELLAWLYRLEQGLAAPARAPGSWPADKLPGAPPSGKPLEQPTAAKPPVQPTAAKPPVAPTAAKPPVAPTAAKPPVAPTAAKPPVAPPPPATLSAGSPPVLPAGPLPGAAPPARSTAPRR
jgi:flagellar biosynthesis protein